MSVNTARSLRRNSSPAEVYIWRRLRDSQLGAKFRRQHPFGPYVLDFYCHDARLVVEIDGSQHFEDRHEAKDKERTRYLEAAGLFVLRFTTTEVFQETDTVIEVVLQAMDRDYPSPQPSPKGRGSQNVQARPVDLQRAVE